MRLLRLDFIEEFSSFEMHPLVTVIQDAPMDRLIKLSRAVRSLGSGSVANLTGLVEHGGLLVTLDGVSEHQLPEYGTTTDTVCYIGGQGAGDSLLARELEASETRLKVAAIRLEELRADLDHEAKAELFSLRQKLAFSQGVEGALSGLSSPERRLALVQRFYDKAEQVPQTVLNTPHGQPQLVEAFSQLEQLEAQVQEQLKAQHQTIANLEASQAELKEAWEQASLAAKPILLSSTEEQRLETLSDPSSDLSRKGKWRHQLTDEETAELHALLAKVGVETATEYKIFRLNPTAPRELVDAAANARLEYETASNRLKVERARLEATPELGRLREQRSELERQASGFLGPVLPSNIIDALQSLSKKEENPEWLVAVEELRRVLVENELSPPNDLRPAEIMGWTDSWLRGESSVTENFAAEQIDEAQVAAQISEAERRFAKHARALGQINEAGAAYMESQDRAGRLSRTLANYANPGAEPALDQVEQVILGITSAIRPASSAVPLMIVSEFEGVADDEIPTLMDTLTRVSDNVQIIVVSNRRILLEWVEQAGLQVASAITSRSRVAA